MSETPKTDRSASNAGQSCRECRRRKGKCDGKMPVCSICARYNRHCLYDKHSRSSLTRKHLTEVEERLEKAEAILRAFFTDAELSQMLVHGATALRGGVAPGSTTSPDRAGLSPRSDQARPRPSPHRSDSVSTTGPDPGQPPEPAYYEATSAPRAGTQDAAPLPFEKGPSADDGFEWDEREASWDSSATTGAMGAAHPSGLDVDIRKISDGMATLTTDDSNTGFLGNVSGAALLRLIWMGHNADAVADKPELEAEPRKGLEGLLKARSTEQPLPASWLRSESLVTQTVKDTLIDAYFHLYHPTFPILHEPTFREQYAKLKGRLGGTTWHILANLVAALGSFVSTTWSDDTHVTLFNLVKANLPIDSLETGSLSLVQIFALAANYLQKRNRPNSGYNYGGIALRLAISLGLHKEFRGWQTTPFKKEIRRRVWWSLCVLDVGATVTYGRPLNWPQVGVDIPFPLNIHEQDLPPDASSTPDEANEATLYTYLRTQSSYHLRTIRIYNRLISSPVPSATELIALDDEVIEGWLSSLPPYYRDEDPPLPQAFLLGHGIGRWRFRLMRIIMYRPFLIRWAQEGFGSTQQSSSPSEVESAENLAVDRCFKAAEDCISAIFQFWSTGTHTRLAAWYVLYFLLQAALIPIHCLRRNPNHVNAASWRSQVQTVLNIINAMHELNPSATKCRDIIHRLCGRSLSTSFSARHWTRQGSSDWSNGQDERTFGAGASAAPLPGYDATDAGVQPWITEIDTAINGYDHYCDQLGNVAMAGMGRMDDFAGPSNVFTAEGTQIGTGVQNWDWGLMM